MKDWSQYGEQKLILDHFGDRVGRFLDVGAHAAEANSNTRALMELGWGGICVEPSPYVFASLLENTAAFPDVTCINAAVDERTGLLPFYASIGGDQLSTSEQSHRDKWRAGGYPFTRGFYVVAVAFKDLPFPGPFHFLNIDTEGSNLRVLKSAPLDEMGVELVCVEKDDVNATALYLVSVGFEVIAETGSNLIAKRA